MKKKKNPFAIIIKRERQMAVGKIAYRKIICLSFGLSAVFMILSYMFMLQDSSSFMWVSNALLNISMGFFIGFIFFAFSNVKTAYMQKVKKEIKLVNQAFEYARTLRYNASASGIAQGKEAQKQQDALNYCRENFEQFLSNCSELLSGVSENDKYSIKYRSTNNSIGHTESWNKAQFMELLQSIRTDESFCEVYFLGNEDVSKQLTNLFEQLEPLCDFCDFVQRERRYQSEWNDSSII